TGFIDVFGLFESRGIARRLQRVEIGHDAVFPNESAAIGEVRVARNADDLTFFINSVGFTVNMSGQRTEWTNAVGRGPDERVQVIAVRNCGIRGEADNIPALVDIRRCVPPWRAEIGKIDILTVVPKKPVSRGVSS